MSQNEWSEVDQQMMLSALQLAAGGEGGVEPNPMVGCVIARDGEIVGSGFHRQFGGPHAEVEALRSLDRLHPGLNDLRDATVYVTLEPCCHEGKTPPCATALIERSPGRVVIAVEDPFPEVNGGGIAAMRDAGITVDVGLLQREATELLGPYLKTLRTGQPWVIAKWAMTLDGRIATENGSSRWISNAASRQVVHRLRSRMDGIVVGIRTVLADDPMLDIRLDPENQPPPGNTRLPMRIVLDSSLQLPLTSRLAQSAEKIPVLVFCQPDVDQIRAQKLTALGVDVCPISSADPSSRMAAILQELGRRKMTNVLVEGGAKVLGSFLDAHAIDEVHVFVAPKIVGGESAFSPIGGIGCEHMADAIPLPNRIVEMIDGDIYFRGRTHYESTQEKSE
jgi:diaminohydroxyphosphoribosylaminopyrimidine deaminase/5-amino-6-(5-phosphoribosylamino)uracil reductase